MLCETDQEKALVGAFSVIVHLRRLIVYSSTRYSQSQAWGWVSAHLATGGSWARASCPRPRAARGAAATSART